MKTRYQVALPISLLVLTILCGFFLSSTIVKADDTTSDSVSIQIDIACTITTGGGTYSDTIDPGTYKEITGNPINVSCNDPGGYALYAIGFSGDSYDAPDNNKMLGPNSNYIPTANSGSSSYWAMKVAGSSSSSAVPTIDNSYSSYQIIPATYTEVSHYPSSTVGTTDNSVTTPTYKVNISSAQPVGTYTGKVKYTIVHPSTAPAPVPPISMQDMTIADCSTTPKTVYDKRDGKSYTVAKLADDNCWMLENLRLDLTDSTTKSNLTSATTNATDASLAYIIGGSGVTYRDATSDPNGNRPTAGLNSTAWTSSDQNFYSVPMIVTSGTCYNDFCVDSPSSGQWNSEVVTPATINDVTSIAQGKVGIYYNYCAASAGSYCYGNGTSSKGSPSSDPDPSSIRDVTEDLCPVGWHMPTGHSNGGEYNALYTAYNSDYTAFQTALNTPLSGYFYSGTAYVQGANVNFWSSTWGGAAYARLLSVYSSNVDPSNYGMRNDGYSVRCSLGS